jgi:hypothetical protein
MRSPARCSAILVPVLALAAALAGCNSSPVATAPTPAVPAASTYASERFAPDDFKLPAGAGCSGAVARFRAIMDNDYRSGNVNQAVYTQIQGEIQQAAGACAGGRDAEASGMIRASRSRHGYPAG